MTMTARVWIVATVTVYLVWLSFLLGHDHIVLMISGR